MAKIKIQKNETAEGKKPDNGANVSCCPGLAIGKTEQPVKNAKPPYQNCGGHEHPG